MSRFLQLLAVALAVALLLVLAGCATGAGQGSRLLPWNWFSPDANARAAKADANLDRRQADAVHAAHREVAKAQLVLRAAPVSAERELALRFLGNGLGLLDQVRPLAATEAADDRALVADFLSGLPERMAAAEKRQAEAEGAAAKLSRDLAAAQALIDEANRKLAEANRTNAEGAAKYRRLWFWIYAIAGGWLALQLLAGAARFYPGLAPVAAIAGRLSAPVVQAAYERATVAVGRALATVEKASDAAGQLVRAQLDAETDAAEQTMIRRHYQAARP
jgi:hypothetical protein